ncbi:MAG TPA: hypothetical protein VIP11_11435 [Gemmatimonadaceae bacterium]
MNTHAYNIASAVRRWRVGGIALAAAASACGKDAAARLVVGSADTLVVHGHSPVAIPVHLFDSVGRELRVRDAQFELISGSHVRLSAGNISCDGADDARVGVRSRNVTTVATVLCRPIRALRLGHTNQLFVGDPPQALAVAAIDARGRAVSPLAFGVRIRDTTVATLRDGGVTGRAPGITMADLTVGDCGTTIILNVVERVTDASELRPDQIFETRLRLVPGEVRYWRLPRGLFDVRLTADTAPRKDELVLGAIDANCNRFPDGGQHYSCIAKENNAFVARHLGRPGRSQELSGTLLIRRLHDAQAGVSAHTDAQPRNLGDGASTLPACLLTF